MKVKILLVMLMLFYVNNTNAQVTQDWVQRYNGPGNSADDASSIAVDNQGNVYVTGRSNVISQTSFDYATIKYNSDGVEQWVQRYNGPGDGYDQAAAIAVDNEGNVYVTGSSTGSGSSYDYATIKYNSDGVEQWVQRYNGPGNYWDVANSIAVDSEGNVYVTGYSTGSGSSYDYATIKYNSDGVEQWVQRYNGPGNYTDEASSIAVDNEGNVYVTGSSVGSGSKDDYATIKYNSGGVEQWVQRYNGPANYIDKANSIAFDIQGNVYVTGFSTGSGSADGYATIKYNSDGAEQWVQGYNGPGNSSDQASSIAVDNEGDVYVTGYSTGSGSSVDYATIKYDSAGVEQWVQRYDGGNGNDIANAIAVDNEGNVFVTGFSMGSGSSNDFVTIKYSQGLTITNPLARELWIAGEKDTIRWNAPGIDSINILFSADYNNGAGSFEYIAENYPADSGYYVWDIPDTILSRKCNIMIEDVSNSNVYANSEVFKIKGYVLTKYLPNGDYKPYSMLTDTWGFANYPNDVWPATWWQQFDYQGTDPFTGSQYSQWQGNFVFATTLSSVHPDWSAFVNTFGTSECYRNTTLRLYSPTALSWWESVNNFWAGSCFGIAISNFLAWENKISFQNRYPNFPDFINASNVSSDTNTIPVINELFTHQFGNPHSDYRSNIALNKTPNQTLNDLKQMFITDSVQLQTLSFLNNPPGTGGHAILAYKVEKDIVTPNIFYVYAYDNSYPDSLNARIVFNTTANGGNGSWSFNHWPGWGGNKWIYLRDVVSNYLTNPTINRGTFQQSTFILGDNILRVNTGNDASVRIQDNNGNITGYYNGSIQDDIPKLNSIYC